MYTDIVGKQLGRRSDLPGLPDLVKKQRVCFSFKISLEEKDWCSRSGKIFLTGVKIYLQRSSHHVSSSNT